MERKHREENRVKGDRVKNKRERGGGDIEIERQTENKPKRRQNK